MTKRTGKGKALDISPYSNSISQVNKWKMCLANVSEDVPVVEWRPLVSWPAKPHARQAEIDRFCHKPSLVR